MFNKKTALLVDDFGLSQRLLKNILIKIGFSEENLASVHSGKEAIEKMTLAHKNSQDFDFIFLDLNMPEMTGTQVLENLKANESLNPKSRIILFTAEPNKSVLLNAIKLGAHAHVAKPPSEEDVLDKLQ